MHKEEKGLEMKNEEIVRKRLPQKDQIVPSDSVDNPAALTPVRQRSHRRGQCVTLLVIAVFGVIVLYIYYRNWHGTPAQADHYDPQQVKCRQYSPAYPTAGGGGCSPKCTESESRKNSSYAAVFYNKTHNWPKDLLQNMHRAASILKRYGSPHSLDTERNCYLHVSLDYYCCYTIEEGSKIGEFLNKYPWTPHEVWFDRLVCAIHAPEDMVSLVLMVDENSQKSLLRLALDTEQDLEAETGVHKHIPHTQLQDFHMTLGVVNQSIFPVHPAVEEINRVIPPGTWHSTPVILHRPLCTRCSKVMSLTKTVSKEKRQKKRKKEKNMKRKQKTKKKS